MGNMWSFSKVVTIMCKVIRFHLEFGVCCGFCLVHWPAFECDVFGGRIRRSMSRGQDYELNWVNSTSSNPNLYYRIYISISVITLHSNVSQTKDYFDDFPSRVSLVCLPCGVLSDRSWTILGSQIPFLRPWLVRGLLTIISIAVDYSTASVQCESSFPHFPSVAPIELL